MFKRKGKSELEMRVVGLSKFGSYFHTYLSVMRLLSECYAVDAVSCFNRYKSNPVAVEYRADGLRILFAVGQSSFVLPKFLELEFECGPEFPVASFRESLSKARDVLSRYSVVLAFAGYAPAGHAVLVKPQSCSTLSNPVPTWEQLASCAPHGPGQHRECSNDYSIMAVATDALRVHVVLASSLVPTSLSSGRLKP